MSVDPFAGADKHPSVTWETVGKTVKGIVVEAPSLVQSRDYNTGEPATWKDGNPKMTVVTTIDVNGEVFGLWAAKPGALYKAIADAQKEAGAMITVGGTLTVTFTHEIPDPDGKKFAAKQFRVSYQRPNAFADQRADQQQYQPPVQQQSNYAQTAPQTSQPEVDSFVARAQATTAVKEGPTATQVAGVRAAGLKPEDVWPGYVDPQPPF